MLIKIPKLTEYDDSRSLILTYFKILNVINPKASTILTDNEIRVLTEFTLLPEKYSYQRFSKYAKPVIIQSLKLQYNWTLTPANLNTKIYDLIGKEYL